MLAKMRNLGEACTAANRIYVHEEVACRLHREAHRRGWRR
jgi:succinate-semialdehyde dehydrogenase/glutarate-semialdehyde dehydrogenase